MQLDDWVLCRLYNKKGVLEKHVSSDVKDASFSDIEIDTKPNITSYSPMDKSSTLHPPSSIPYPIRNDAFNFETSESVGTFHTDSSLEHEREVESEVRKDGLQFGYLDPFTDDSFTAQTCYFNDYQPSPLQDMFMYQM